MKVTIDLIDQVIFYKGRLWTVYATSGDGVFAYQGLKPYASFNYSNDSYRFSTFRRNIISLNADEITILSGEEIEAAIKKEKAAEKKPLTRKKAIEFFVYLTGHSKAFVSKNIRESGCRDSFDFTPGAFRYSLWKSSRGEKSFLLLSNNMKGSESHAYFDYITFETDDIETERSWEEIKQEIIDNYKELKGIED